MPQLARLHKFQDTPLPDLSCRIIWPVPGMVYLENHRGHCIQLQSFTLLPDPAATIQKLLRMRLDGVLMQTISDDLKIPLRLVSRICQHVLTQTITNERPVKSKRLTLEALRAIQQEENTTITILREHASELLNHPNTELQFWQRLVNFMENYRKDRKL